MDSCAGNFASSHSNRFHNFAERVALNRWLDSLRLLLLILLTNLKSPQIICISVINIRELLRSLIVSDALHLLVDDEMFITYHLSGLIFDDYSMDVTD